MTNFDNYLTKVTSLKTDIQNLLNMVSAPGTGLVSSLNCGFMKISTQNFYNSICIAMVVPLTTLTTLIGLCSFGMFFLSFFVYIAASKLAK